MVQTILRIVDSNGKKIYSYKTQRFTETTTTKDIVAFILQKSNKFQSSLHIEIHDKSDGDFVTLDDNFVTLDDDYLAEYDPFNPNNVDTTTGRVTNLPGKPVKLKITLLDYDCLSTISQAVVKTTEVLSTSIQQTEDTYQGDKSLLTSEASAILTIELPEDPKMGFVPGHNVNDTQRDQYISDAKNVATGKITGKLAKIQAGKELPEKYASKLPKFRIWHHYILKEIGHQWKLIGLLVLDVCKSGQRSLYSHPERTFVEKDNLEKIDQYEINIEHRDLVAGKELELLVAAIKGAKLTADTPLNILCHIKNNQQNKSSDSAQNFQKSRIAFLLQKDGVLLWETLVLSDEMNFERKLSKSTLAPPSNVSTDTTATTSQRNKSKRLPMTVSSSKNNTSYITSHPDLPVHFTASQISDTVFQGSSDNTPFSLEHPLSLSSDLERILDSINTTDSRNDVFNDLFVFDEFP
ncbi:unnamed protein product [Rotaria magnacalcarata]|uniref:Uncharacterized protein n=2 Tax=Rotaria magnacalcarata TaxID=392030 RepID=A0A816SMZ9_9BILA|nr:unnamed protein product [Rotaria magnacalcarata]CAF4429447.1 unnamed protein product [Rotaria magnacalcarata]